MAGKKSDETPKVLEKIAAWPEERRALGERLHEIVLGAVPDFARSSTTASPATGAAGPCSCSSAATTGWCRWG